jgi:hypothetical protein
MLEGLGASWEDHLRLFRPAGMDVVRVEVPAMQGNIPVCR